LTKNLSIVNSKYFEDGMLSETVWVEPGIRDPGSGKNLPWIRIQGSKKHQITDPDSNTEKE
jgi:hypothetical protein